MLRSKRTIKKTTAQSLFLNQIAAEVKKIQLIIKAKYKLKCNNNGRIKLLL